MLAITIAAVVAVTAVVRFAIDERIQRFAISRQVGRVAIVGAVVAVIVAVIAIDPVKQYDEFKAPPTGQETGAGSVGFLRGGGSGRYQFWETAVNAFESAPVGGVGASGYTPYWFEHRADPDPRPARPLAAVRDAGRARDRRPRAAASRFFGAAVVAGVRRAASAGAITEAAPALGPARRRLRRRGRRLDLGPAGRLRGDDRRGGAAHRAGDALRPGPGAAGARRGRAAAGGSPRASG